MWGEAKGLRGAELERQISAVAEQTKIGDVRRKRISALSKGYRQRVGIAQALLGNPEVIILDEPTVGLDPLQIIEIRTLVKELGQSHTVIFSSHILSEVQNLCDQILIISRGKLVAFDRPENLEKRLLGSNEITVVTDAPPAEASALLAGGGGAHRLRGGGAGRRPDGAAPQDGLHRAPPGVPGDLLRLCRGGEGPAGAVPEKGQPGGRVPGADRAPGAPGGGAGRGGAAGAPG